MDPVVKHLDDNQRRDLADQMRKEMRRAAEALDFEKAARLRDEIEQIEALLNPKKETAAR